jgi:hypothetical protein
MMPLVTGPRSVQSPPLLAHDKSFRALHHLSHGDPMPTSENSFQVPGYVEMICNPQVYLVGINPVICFAWYLVLLGS